MLVPKLELGNQRTSVIPACFRLVPKLELGNQQARAGAWEPASSEKMNRQCQRIKTRPQAFDHCILAVDSSFFDASTVTMVNDVMLVAGSQAMLVPKLELGNQRKQQW